MHDIKYRSEYDGTLIESQLFGKTCGPQGDLFSVKNCYNREIELVCDALQSNQHVLVHCDWELFDYFSIAVSDIWSERIHKMDGTPKFIDPVLGIPQAPSGRYLESIRAALPAPGKQFASDDDGLQAEHHQAIVLRHPGMLSARAGQDESVLLFLQQLQGCPYFPMLGLFDPSVHSPDQEPHLQLLNGLFLDHVHIGGTPRNRISYGLWPEAIDALVETRGKWTGRDRDYVHQFLGDLNVIEMRRVVHTMLARPKRETDEEKDPPMKRDELVAAMRELAGKYPMRRPERVEERDIGGYSEIKELIHTNFLLPFKLGMLDTLGRGILFHGPPGTGKTHFAKWIATELTAYLIVINGPEVKSKWFGESERLIRDVFRRARENQPAIIVIEEFDALGRARDSQGLASSADVSVVNTLLAELGGLCGRDQIIFIATTNRHHDLDAALSDRLGRIEFSIAVDFPSRKDSRDILQQCLAKTKIKDCLPEEQVAAWVDTIIPEEAPSASSAPESSDLFALSEVTESGVKVKGLTGDDIRMLCDRMDRIYLLYAKVKTSPEAIELPPKLRNRMATFDTNSKDDQSLIAARIRDCAVQEFREQRRLHLRRAQQRSSDRDRTQV